MPANLGEAFREPRSLDFSTYTRTTASDLSSLKNPDFSPPSSNESTNNSQNGSILKQDRALGISDDVSDGHVSDLTIDADDHSCERSIARILSCSKCRKQMRSLLKAMDDETVEGFSAGESGILKILTDRDFLIYVGYGVAIIILLSYFRR